MDAVFYLLLILNFGFGVLAVVFLSTVTTEPHDPGARSLALPFIPLTITTALQIVEYYVWNRYTGRVFVIFPLLADLAIVGIAFSWNYIAVRHYRLNDINVRFRFPAVLDTVTGIAGIAGVLALFVVVTVVWIPTQVAWVHAAVFTFLFYAAFRGVIIIRNASQLLPSSRTAAIIATVSFFTYPLIAFGDLAGWNLPFLDPQVSFWVQAHPLYITMITILVVHYIYHNQQRTPTAAAAGDVAPDQHPAETSEPAPIPDSISQRLTHRENEILLLLYEGPRYREIAEQLHVSINTVRTHVHHIYEKLDISRREELFLILRDGAPPPR